ncbi:Hypothetical protein EUBREC_2182 [Agathobacter rectalis ATCC 33656]|uniref:Uncharacterized protein n=1 Tax=Agathobacter rectalis (strain ATCC 33656 / DSM 3377 / JCM 17463 / KCTC 5835 / VPI 0990) TaxID=515619 RepID=C4ZCH6_AGARV|nr:Hypothetical protein EUBREC_2182 [Agathobacter rectalis ATCC 33656]
MHTIHRNELPPGCNIYHCCSNASLTPRCQAMRQCVNYCQITAPAS